MKKIITLLLISFLINNYLYSQFNIITEQPNDISVCENTDAFFKVKTKTNCKYTWQFKTNSADVWEACSDSNGNYNYYNTDSLIIFIVPFSYNNNYYRCKVSSILPNCKKTEISNSAKLTVLQNPTAYAGVDDSICKNSTYPLSGSATNYQSVLWTTAGDGYFDDTTSLTAIYTPGTNDTSSVTLTLTAYAPPCGEFIDSICLTVNKIKKPHILPKPNDANTTPYILICTDTGYLYQWYGPNDSLIRNATLQFYYTPNYSNYNDTIGGDYYVKITDKKTGCESVKSNTITITKTEKKDKKNINIYPNPNNGNFIIQILNNFYSNNNETLTVKIWSCEGKLIKNFKINYKNTNKKITTNIPYVKGLYFIEVINNNGIYNNSKFIIK